MCGITGYFSPNKVIDNTDSLYRGTSLIAHRGPDDEGYALFNLATHDAWSLSGPDSYHAIKSKLPLITASQMMPHHMGFGFRRLSIIDLTEKGHQPFWNKNKTCCLIFNGEIYNYVEIREELKQLGCTFETTCDTEVLLVGYQVWGMDVLKRCNGPMAFALYDKESDALFLARDRLGKNPLYYAVCNNALYWASEIKPILSMTGHASFEINEQAIYDYLNFGWRDINYTTFWKGIHTLPAASWTKIALSQPPTEQAIHDNLRRYWDFPASRLKHTDIPLEDATEQFRDLFTDAVKIRGRADAKVAYSLSGGMDSSSIVAAAANVVDKPFRTYSIKFPGLPQDEEPLARKVYERYPEKIDYHIFTPQNTDFWESCDSLITQMEEPFHFPNIQPFQAYLRNAQQEGYKVVLVGGGGDELLAGYSDYFYPLQIQLRQEGRLLPLLGNLFGDRDMWGRYSLIKRLKVLVSLLVDPNRIRAHVTTSFFNRRGERYATNYFNDINIEKRVRCRVKDVPLEFHPRMIGYMSDWLMNYWLRSGDHFQFGVSVETRRPFLDYRLIDFVFSLPPEYLVSRGWRKYILRNAVSKWLPREVVWRRKKQGFPFNTKSWFTHAKPIASEYLKSVSNNPYFNTSALLEDYDTLLVRNPGFLWRGICFCLWWRRLIENRSL